ncbi:MAG: NAD(P)H-dependent oxidoreductase [Eubacteriales bacterium]|nr:NAD(P)H-dependent oxidoreductase [Eubacteriales bacterium]MDD4323399.1 NAD(P)H-dependent oxidoreductase [Eubacteriales bacterium]MDD4540715.1 NAD(P)H-dependent oxidoreductase [Eubacteriales bacterium]
MTKVGVLVGSLRKGSYSRKLAENLVEYFPEVYETEFIEIVNLPFYNEDLDTGTAPDEYTKFRRKMHDMDAFLFVTPEYNRSVPAVLKNALDVGSRPYGDSVWAGKTGAIVSNSPSNLSGFGANHHLRQSMVFLDVQMLKQPEAYIANIADLLDENGKINNEGTVKFLKSVIAAFVELIETFKK